MKNVFASLPANLEKEVFEDLLKADGLRIERIISKGHSSPAQGWYDQDEHEWVLVLEGSALIELEDGSQKLPLKKGDYLNIPAHTRHRVAWTHPDDLTIWLAIFYR